MKRVLVIGCPGAGKSTFGRKLAAKTSLPLLYPDMLDDEFRQWILDFSKDQLTEILNCLKEFKGNVCRFRTRDEADKFADLL